MGRGAMELLCSYICVYTFVAIKISEPRTKIKIKLLYNIPHTKMRKSIFLVFVFVKSHHIGCINALQMGC